MNTAVLLQRLARIFFAFSLFTPWLPSVFSVKLGGCGNAPYKGLDQALMCSTALLVLCVGCLVMAHPDSMAGKRSKRRWLLLFPLTWLLFMGLMPV
ncbi:MAG: hypothetical protein ACAH95_08960 [Fimbriimonas sp.]